MHLSFAKTLSKWCLLKYPGMIVLAKAHAIYWDNLWKFIIYIYNDVLIYHEDK